MSRRPSAPAVENALLVAFGLIAIMVALVPVDLRAGGLPLPDLVYALVAAWVIRRPATTPVWIVVGLGLAADFLLSRPIGLGALALLAATEGLRANAGLINGGPFLLEWLAVTVGFAAMLAGMQILLQLALAAGPGLGPALGYLAATALAYPLVAGGVAGPLGIRASPGARAGKGLGRLP